MPCSKPDSSVGRGLPPEGEGVTDVTDVTDVMMGGSMEGEPFLPLRAVGGERVVWEESRQVISCF